MPKTRKSAWIIPWLVGFVAVIMGAPTLNGGFVGGDDRQLVLNHVLVNHPSLEHALKLFTIYHRDLYQPIPLLSFSMEFALADALGLLDDISNAAWLFHLTNVLLHAMNSMLVWLVIRAWHRLVSPRSSESAGTVAWIAAMLFAVHPLQVEVVAWLNGRMMLLSTLFALTAIYSLARFVAGGPRRWAALMVVSVLACGISKVRVGLPVLLVILPLLSQRPAGGFDLRSWVASVRSYRFAALCAVWLLATVTMALLALVNLDATAQAGMFDGAAEQWRGPRPARVALSLSWYLRHFLWPSGLGPFYPSPTLVSWTSVPTLAALTVIVGAIAVTCMAGRRSRAIPAGMLWFLVTIATTLPIVPARNLLAADRYMYFPIVGLTWMAACMLASLLRRTAGMPAMRPAVWLAIGSIGVGGVLCSWKYASAYDTYLSKTMRVAELFPESPHVWERVGWSHYSLGEYEKAIEFARRELVHDDAMLKSDIRGLIGLSLLELGRVREGLEELRNGVELVPENFLARHRLAGALADRGQIDEAIAQWEETVEGLPNFNPAINRLAKLYASRGRAPEARRLFDQALRNNSYDVQATLGHVALDIQASDRESILRAERRLHDLLAWMPENATAVTNLGVVYATTGRVSEALGAYQEALRLAPDNFVALVNVAELAMGRPGWNIPAILTRAAALTTTVEQGVVVQDLLITAGEAGRAVAMWRDFGARHPRSRSHLPNLAWSQAVAGSSNDALEVLATVEDSENPTAKAATILSLLGAGRAKEVLPIAAALGKDPSADGTRQRLLQALERYGATRPEDSWTYCVVAELMFAEGRMEAARVATDICGSRCLDEACGAAVENLKVRLGSP